MSVGGNWPRTRSTGATSTPAGASTSSSTTRPRRFAFPNWTSTTAPRGTSSSTRYVNGRATARAVTSGYTEASRLIAARLRQRAEGSGPGGFEHELGGEPEEEPAEQPPRDEDLALGASHHREQLDDHVEDRAAGDGEERRLDPLVHPCLPEGGTQERRPAADQAEQREKAPRRPLAISRHRADDAEALGRVVEAEADHERECELQLVVRGLLPDRQALREVVDADARRDQQAEPLPRRQAADPRPLELRRRGGARAEHRAAALLEHPAVVVDERHQTRDHAAGRS